MSTQPLGKHTIKELLQRAADCDAMAASATTINTAAALLRLGERFRVMARRRVAALTYRPGDPAPLAGAYHELNIFGSPTRTIIQMLQGELLPMAPRGFSWRLDEQQC